MSTKTTPVHPMLTGLKRYDPIHWSDMGGWSYDSASIKEADDGDFVKFDDVSSLAAENALLVERLREAERLLRQSSDWMHMKRKNIPISDIDTFLTSLTPASKP